MERYLQMSDEPPDKIPADMTLDTRTQIQEANWQICNVTTPANYFHLLRRQVHREFRKPLIVISPKNLLRHPKCVSPLSDFDDEEASQTEQGIRFKRLIMDKTATSRNKVDPPLEPNAKRVVFCTGKVYYELDAARRCNARTTSRLSASSSCRRFRGTSWTGSCGGTPTRRWCGARRNP
jgi:2-oxoglutarate dehydrogenase E1 component